jgi:hypothetical protein
MSARIPKKTILQACIIKQQLIVDNFEKEIEGLKKEIFGQDVIPSQGDYSAAERTEVLERYERELRFLKDELQVLAAIDVESEFNEVKAGAVVQTNRQIFFVSVSIERVEVNGTEIFGLSTEAPIYAEMKGKIKGDAFVMNNMEYQIIDIY